MTLKLSMLAAALATAMAACAGPPPIDLDRTTSPATATSEEGTPTSREDTLEQESLRLVNAARQAEGVEPLRVDPLLSATANAHARDMQARGYYAHASPSGDGVQQRHDGAGGAEWRLVAENLARCSRCTAPPEPDRLAHYHQRWMASPGHRANILSPGLDAFGFAAVHGDDGYYLVQNFSGPGEPNDLRPDDSLAPLDPDAQLEDALRRVNAARREAGVEPLALSPALAAALRQVMPRQGDRDFNAGGSSDVQQALADPERDHWTGISTTYGACGACGRAAVAADIRFFMSEWLDRPAYRSLLLDPAATHLAFAIAANGEGRKVALAAVGRWQ